MLRLQRTMSGQRQTSMYSTAAILLSIIVLLLLTTAEFGHSADSLYQPVAKSESTAGTYSLLGWLGPTAFGAMIMSGSTGENGGSPGAAIGGLAIGTFGLVFGPGLGHSYAGNKRQFWIGVGLRLATVGGAFTSFAISWNQTNTNTAELVFYGCAAAYMVSAIYDVSTASRSARRYNEKHRLGNTTVSPCYFVEQKALGVRLTIPL